MSQRSLVQSQVLELHFFVDHESFGSIGPSAGLAVFPSSPVRTVCPLTLTFGLKVVIHLTWGG